MTSPVGIYRLRVKRKVMEKMAAMKKLSLLVVVLAALSPIYAAKHDPDFQRAILQGATVHISIRVVDDEQKPVSDAKIEARFDSALQSAGEAKIVSTDTNGIAVVSGKTGKTVCIQATKSGYYRSSDSVCFVSMGQGVVEGKWQPWNMEKTIILRAVRNPVACQHKVRGYKHVNRVNEWLKFDLEYGDFLPPEGSGKVCDMEVLFDWNGKLGDEYTGMGVKIRFPNDGYSGGYYADNVMCSDFKGVYDFLPNNRLISEFAYSTIEERDSATGALQRRQEMLFDKTKGLIARIRCEVDPASGKLLKFHCAQISDIKFGCNKSGVVFLLKSFFNLTPNDTNLEFDPARNLYQGKKGRGMIP